MSVLLRFFVCLILIAMVLAGVSFSSHNSLAVTLWLGVEFGPQSLGVWMTSAFIIGSVLGLLLGFGLFRTIKYKFKLSQLESKLKQAQLEIESLQGITGSVVKVKGLKKE